MKKTVCQLVCLVLFLSTVSMAQAGIVFTFGANVTTERKAALEAAAAEIEEVINFRQTVKIKVAFTALQCSTSSAVLGFAGPEAAFHSFSGAPQSGIWYVSAQAADFGLAAALAESTHISAEFNTNLGNSGCLQGVPWYFGTDHNPPAGQIDFMVTAVHEFMHGLGFLSFTGSNGKLLDNNGTANSGRLDNYSTFLFDNSTAKSWKTMTDSQRAASIVNNNNLVWSGAKTTSMISLLQNGTTGGKARLFAPSAYESGSSTSHFDVSLLYDTAAHEVMEPYAAFPTDDTMASAVFCDMGWLLLRDTDGDSVNDCSDSAPLASTDTDGDGVTDELDAFPLDPSESLDTDKDGTGNNADPDDDNDSLPDASDNCPLVSNPDQKDFDADGIGDACGDPPELQSFNGKGSKDRTGHAVSFAGDVDQDGYGDYIIGIPGFDVAGAGAKDAGRAVLISGSTGLSLLTKDGAQSKGAFGSAVAGGADADGDGINDFVVGAPREDGSSKKQVDTGSVTVFSGKDGEQLAKIMGTGLKDYFGSSLALGDVDGDGKAEIFVGAPKADDTAKGLKDAGSVTVIRITGKDSFTIVNTLFGATAGANAGTSVAAGDVNNDGNADVIVGAPNDDDTNNFLKDAGSVKVYSAAVTELESMRRHGAMARARLGNAVASGDVNKDNFDDVLVGAPGEMNEDLFLKGAGSVSVISGKLGTQLTKKFGETPKAALGSSTAAGDINGDGFADIIAGAPKDQTGARKGPKAPGSVSIWHGNTKSLVKILYGTASKDLFGSALSTGDINGDGKADLLIGVAGDDVTAARLLKDAGSVQLQSGAEL